MSVWINPVKAWLLFSCTAALRLLYVDYGFVRVYLLLCLLPFFFYFPEDRVPLQQQCYSYKKVIWYYLPGFMLKKNTIMCISLRPFCVVTACVILESLPGLHRRSVDAGGAEYSRGWRTREGDPTNSAVHLRSERDFPRLGWNGGGAGIQSKNKSLTKRIKDTLCGVLAIIVCTCSNSNLALSTLGCREVLYWMCLRCQS